MPFFCHGENELYYRQSGSGKAALLLIHGWYQNGAQAWGKIIPLLEKKYRVFVPDLPGHGLSGLHNPADFSTAVNHALLLGFVRHIKKEYGCRKIILAGHSYGAFAALNLAAAVPHEFAGVAALAAIDDYQPYTKRLNQALSVPAFLVKLYYRVQALLGFFPYGDRMLLYGSMPGVLVPGRLAYAKIKNRTLPPAHSRAYMRAFIGSRVPWPEKPLRLPLLLVYGERDALTAPAWAKKILPHFSDGAVEIVAEAGHNVQISGADKVFPLLQVFAEKCFRRASQT